MRIYKRVFILGAGFSKSFCKNMPIMNDLTGQVVVAPSPDDEYKELKEFAIDKFEKSNKSREIKNIENLATAIFSKRIFQDYSEELFYEKLRTQLLMIIYKNIRSLDVDDENKNLLTNFIRKCPLTYPDLLNESPGENLIMTLNYDLLIENRFKDERSPIGGQKIDYSVGLHQYPPKLPQGWTPLQVEILKLHGSFNWFRAKGAKTNDINSIYIVNEDDDFYTVHKTDVPVYIPMAHSKESFLNGTLFNTIWAKATHYLNTAEEIVFIGYGFPITDINNLIYFLGFKEKIKHVIVYEEKEGDPLTRLKGLFGNDIVQNRDAKDFLMEYLNLDTTRYEI